MPQTPLQLHADSAPALQPTTRIAEVMNAIRARIAARSLTPGEKLPSIRSLAASMRLSTSTVVEAYERLSAEGVIRSRPGSGFFVAGTLAPLSMAEIGPRLDRAVDPFWVSRQSLEADDATLKPGCGWLPPDWLPQEALRRSLRTLARAGEAALTDYGSPLGLPALRQLLARRMAERGVEAGADQIVLTESGTQAIDLVCRFLIEPGDAVLVDDPCYFNFLALLRAHRARIIAVPHTPTGPDVERFAAALAEHSPRLYITNAAIHNPTGATLSPVTAHRVLKLADEARLTIVEDEVFADFETAAAPRLAAFDGLQRVVQVGSFSKTLSAAARVGYVAVRRDWVEGLVDLKIATSLGSGQVSSGLVLNVLRDGSYRKHVEGLQVRLARAMIEVGSRLEEVGIRPWLQPQAGLFLWCRLPEGVDAAALSRAALARDIVLAPGNVFSPSQSADGFMRFNVAQSQDDRLFDFLRHALGGRGGRRR
ncbi:PLP-dependent aminotransferase family protein [Caldimonas tepidiphila]|uniref:aminotransferase-like domain-containing protein n=1 Tax=Caldimonas tepidiphila TaxID=2315841 RepID=UPI000E5C0C70|nr:PLP-dependent aminotransferase family protein [Caldimonas tepidiphila]